jgi:hypothetical protein
MVDHLYPGIIQMKLLRDDISLQLYLETTITANPANQLLVFS